MIQMKENLKKISPQFYIPIKRNLYLKSYLGDF